MTDRPDQTSTATSISSTVVAWMLLALALLLALAALSAGMGGTDLIYAFLGAVIAAGCYVIGRRLRSHAIWIVSIPIGCAHALYIAATFMHG